MTEQTETTRAKIFTQIVREREHQIKKFGSSPRNLKSSAWLAIITEETGEVARAIIEGDSDGYAKELVQVAAVAVAALEDYYQGKSLLEIEDVCPPVIYEGDRCS